MSHQSTEATGLGEPRPAAFVNDTLTPAGCQSATELYRRRVLVASVNIVTYLAMLWVAGLVFGAGGWTVVDILMFVCFMIGLPWTVLGFWNAVIGLWLLHGTRNPLERVAPFAAAADREEPITVETAILMTLRNEDPARAFARLRVVKASVDATGFGDRFAYFVLSDTNDPAVAAEEEAGFAAWQAELGQGARITYRRRTENTGYKAGNLRDFCARWGKDFELMLPLDADSLMSGKTIVRLVRMMQAYPKLGILQSLVVGMPSSSAFARIFQFGMRHGMRSYTMGSAWWIGDCGPFWGHNGLVRIQPFAEQCHLPMLPGGPPLGGHVLSHDQVEAALMRKAGYEVRVLPEECDSWEENPPTILEFTRRDVRWCQGNMQYIWLLGLKGLLPMSRFQLAWAILMFLGVPAWTLMIALLPVKFFDGEPLSVFPGDLAVGLYVTFILMYLSPKLAGLLDIMVTPRGTERYGGWLRFLASAAIELVFSFLQGAASTFRITLFMIGLAFGKSVSWSGQARDTHGIAWTTALQGLWPQLIFGALVIFPLLWLEPEIVAWGGILLIGFLIAIPFAVLTADPALGRAFVAMGLCGIPEDFSTPPEVVAVQAAGRKAATP